MIFTTQLTAFASSSKTVTSRKSMTLVLNPGVTGNSSIATFNFNSLPRNAIVKDVEVKVSGIRNIGSGMGAIVPQSITITNPKQIYKKVSWNSYIMSTSAFTGDSAQGTWSVYVTGTNVAYGSSASFIGAVEYSTVKMTITYTLER